LKVRAVIKPTSDAFKSLKYYIPSTTRAVKEQSNFTIGAKSSLKDNYQTTNSASIGNLPKIEHANFVAKVGGPNAKEQSLKFSKFFRK